MKLVNRIEIEKPEITYNLHVQNNNNYVAQGVVVSNCHLAKAAMLTSLLIKHGAHIPVRIGCTGTMPKDAADYKTIYAAIGEREVYTIAAKTLQDQNLLATLHITQVVMKDSANPKNEVFPEYAMEKAAVALIEGRSEWIANFIQRISEQQGNTLVLVSSIKQGRKLQKLIEGSVFIYGQDDDATRQEAYQSFASNDNIVVIANVQIAGTGLSIDRIFNLVILDIGKAFTRVIQSIGRGLRMSHDKSHVEVYDIGTNFMFGSRHMARRKTYYKESKYPTSSITAKYR
jgi:superfamily II DNA or RNA helicase